jgi:hypothetical protein
VNINRQVANAVTSGEYADRLLRNGDLRERGEERE